MTQSQQELDIFAQRVLSGVSTTRKIGDAIGERADEVTTVRRRWGTVLQYNPADNTIDARIDGIILPNLRVVSWYNATIGETVVIEYAGNDPICIGPVGYSAPNKFARADHTHVNQSLPIPVYTRVKIDVANNPAGYVMNSNALVLDDVDEVIYNMGGDLTITGIWTKTGSAYIDHPDGRVMKLRFVTHTKARKIYFTDNNKNGVSTPTTIIPPFSVAKDSWALASVRFNFDEKRWQLDNFTGDFGRKVIPIRPAIRQRWTKGGVGTSVTINTGQAATAGSVIVLFHCNDYGYWGEMQAPSGTIPAANWTFIGGGGKDFAAHVNCWAATIPSNVSSNLSVTVNQAYAFSTEMFFYIIDNVQFPKASFFKLMSSASPTTRQTAVDTSGFTPQTTYESLQINTWSYADKAQVTNMFGDLQGDETLATPLQVDGSDANGTYSTGLSGNRFLDVPNTQWQVYTDTSAATDYAAGTLILPVAS